MTVVPDLGFNLFQFPEFYDLQIWHLLSTAQGKVANLGGTLLCPRQTGCSSLLYESLWLALILCMLFSLQACELPLDCILCSACDCCFD
jgi:hypothetical protein